MRTPPHRSVILALTPKQAEILQTVLDKLVAQGPPSGERASLALTRDHLREARNPRILA